jgi:hypothetical protein
MRALGHSASVQQEVSDEVGEAYLLFVEVILAAAVPNESILVIPLTPTQLRDVVQDMMDQYVVEGSRNQVNLPGKMRVQLEKDLFSWLGTVRHLGLAVRVTG